MDSFYRNEDFLREYFLSRENALDYFSLSPFYDTTCNNEILKLQTQYSQFDFSTQLKKMKGNFYELAYSNEENTLFIIVFKNSERNVILNAFYILNGDIFEGVTNNQLYDNRVEFLFSLLNEEIDSYVKNRHLKKDKAKNQIILDDELTILFDAIFQ